MGASACCFTGTAEEAQCMNAAKQTLIEELGEEDQDDAAAFSYSILRNMMIKGSLTQEVLWNVAHSTYPSLPNAKVDKLVANLTRAGQHHV